MAVHPSRRLWIDDPGVGLLLESKRGRPGRAAKAKQARNSKDLKALERHYTLRTGTEDYRYDSGKS